MSAQTWVSLCATETVVGAIHHGQKTVPQHTVLTTPEWIDECFLNHILCLVKCTDDHFAISTSEAGLTDRK